MAILVIVLAMSATSLQKFFKGRTLDSEARQFLALTRYAQSRATSEGMPITLWINKKAGTYGAKINVNYEQVDSKAIEFTLARDLTIQMGNQPLQKANSTITTSTIVNTKKADEIEFTPDGFLDENTPWVEIDRPSVSTLWLAPDRSLSRFEIKTNDLFITQKR